MRLALNLLSGGAFVSTFVITLFIFRFLDQLVMEVKIRDRFLRLAFAAFNGVTAFYGMTFYHNTIPWAVLVLVLDICYVLEYVIMSRDELKVYTYMGSLVFFNNLMVYVLVYSVSRFFPLWDEAVDLYQRAVFGLANLIYIGIIILYRLPAFPVRELRRVIHSPERVLLNIWFPIVSAVTFLNVIIILPAMEGAWISQDARLNHGREVAFYVLIAEWAVLLMSSSYLVVYYQAGRLGVRDKFLDAREQADCQPLTGLLNRRAWERKVREILVSGRKGYLIMIDLDHFKEVNDNMGHQEGDRILKETVQMLRQTFREMDIIGHIGGDEFCVFLVGELKEEVVEQRLRYLMTLRRKEFPLKKGGTFRLSLSMGYTAVPEQGALLEDLIAESDIALYWQKEHGRNGFTMFQEKMRLGGE